MEKIEFEGGEFAELIHQIHTAGKHRELLDRINIFRSKNLKINNKMASVGIIHITLMARLHLEYYIEFKSGWDAIETSKASNGLNKSSCPAGFFSWIAAHCPGVTKEDLDFILNN